MADPETAAGDSAPGAWARRLPAWRGEMGVAAALLGAALFFVWQSASLPVGSIGLPGPGFFPLALGSALALLALAILAHVTATRAARSGDVAVTLGHRDVLVVLSALAAVAACFEWLGAYASLGLLTAVLLRAVARSPLWRAALGAVLGMVAVWAIFRIGLGVRLPAGPF